MRPLPLCLILLLIALLQITLLNNITICEVKPDLFLIFVVFVSFYGREIELLAANLAAGMLRDIYSLDPLGLHALLFALCGYLVWKVRFALFKEHPFTEMIVVLIVSLILNFLYLGYFFAKAPFIQIGSVISIAMLSSLYTAIAAPFCLYPLKKLRGWFGLKASRRFDIKVQEIKALSKRR